MKNHGFMYWFDCPHCPEHWNMLIDDPAINISTCYNCGKQAAVDQAIIDKAYIKHLEEIVNNFEKPAAIKLPELITIKTKNGERLISQRFGSIPTQIQHAVTNENRWLIDLLQHTRKEAGNIEIIFCNQIGEQRKDYDFGEHGRTPGGSMCCITPYETHMHIDGFGRFGLPIRRIPILESTQAMRDKADNDWRKPGLSEATIKKNRARADEEERLMNIDPELKHYFRK